MSNYYFKENSFVIENYTKQATFSNFLPGIAGKKGIPLWAFYVNRGQGISGFGVQDKNRPIMEFTPANKAYESVGQIGFRTFLKVNGAYYEPFAPTNENTHRMFVDQDGFTIEEEMKQLGLHIKIKYYGLPTENLAGLVRKVTVQNTTDKDVQVDILDGLAEIIPAGIKNAEFKEISNLLSSWMDVDDLEKGYAFYKLRSSTADESEVVEILSGNFFFTMKNGELVRPIVDQEVVFQHDNSKQKAFGLLNASVESLRKEENVTVNKVPCGFSPLSENLKAKTTVEFNTVVGYTHNKEDLTNFIAKAKTENYFTNKEQETSDLINSLLADVETSTSKHEFNQYIKQNYLDNLLRGGYPEAIGDTIYHLYSRRHGDLERDYNFFSLAPEYYSQGGGNFRDVCQNRRMDSMMNRDVKDFNVKHFASLIQLDGYNPLTINGMTYHIDNKQVKEAVINKHFGSKKAELFAFLSNKFTPGGLVNFVENNHINVLTSEQQYLDEIIIEAAEEIESIWNEGYWADHFTYILDLVETYEAIYPDKMDDLLFHENDIKTFDSPISVLPKDQKAVINSEGNIRQYGSLLHHDHEKMNKLGMNEWTSNWARIGEDVYKTNLFTKLLILTLNKHSNLDPDLIGIEMEANKPGWNDAMNGVPGLFGSGVSETIELLRIVEYLLAHLPKQSIDVPHDIVNLLFSLENASTYQDVLNARETYRNSIRFGLDKDIRNVSKDRLEMYLNRLKGHILDKIELVYEENDFIVPTFLVYDVKEYDKILDNNNNPVIGNYHMPLVHPKKYERRNLPNFLEAPARLLKTDFDKDKLRNMYKKIKESGIYDKELRMYKTSDSLENETNEIGRVRAFTKGWLERESNFLHMTYKYLLGLLRAGLYDEYYQELEDNLICFMDPNVYKRSTLENSSFIAPTNNPNKKIHGQGFFARLSGSTAETINMWMTMMTGGTPFKTMDENLVFQLEPKLPASYFKEDNTVSFTLLKDIQVTLINGDQVNTYEEGKVVRYELSNHEETVRVDGVYIKGHYAQKIRDGLYKKIKIYIEK